MSEDDGHVVGATQIVDHGPDTERWNLVVVGDGYQKAELDDYRDDVEDLVEAIRQTPPLDDLFRAINVHRVDVVSTDSGADDPDECSGGSGTTADTYFDATYCSTGPGGERVERLLTIDSGLALDVATEHVPNRHQVLCIVNSAKYGGSGGAIATCSTHAQASEIAIHELGHSAFGLADEYGGEGTGTPDDEPAQPNVTRDIDRATNKWRHLVETPTPMPSQCDPDCDDSDCDPPDTAPPVDAVGTYEGAIYSDCNTYRPLPSCYMRDYGPFCPVCAEVIWETLASFLPERIEATTGAVARLLVHGDDDAAGRGERALLDSDVVVELHNRPGESFAFPLRPAGSLPASRGMLALLRRALATGSPVRLEYERVGPTARRVFRVIAKT